MAPNRAVLTSNNQVIIALVTLMQTLTLDDVRLVVPTAGVAWYYVDLCLFETFQNYDSCVDIIVYASATETSCVWK